MMLLGFFRAAYKILYNRLTIQLNGPSAQKSDIECREIFLLKLNRKTKD
jgi:hypothetical protein